MWFDTHAHLYLPQFDDDRNEVMERALAAGVTKIALPNIDTRSIDPVFDLCDQYPGHCLPMIGMHPCSIGQDYILQLEHMEKRLQERSLCAIGEIGLDFYWDTTFKNQQEDAFRQQCSWAHTMNLPIVIHSRESINRNIEILEEMNLGITGIFHCFTGDPEQAQRIIDLGFLLGIGGVLTFRNSGLAKTLMDIDISNMVLETDSPYLAPVPHRGKRNESSFVVLAGQKLAEIKELSKEEVAAQTTANAEQLFKAV